MYSTVASVLELVPLLDNIDKNIIKSFLHKAGQLLNSHINDLYQTPIRKSVNLSGKITINSGSNVIVGFNSSFTNLPEFSFLYMPNKNKTVKLISCENDNVGVIDEISTVSYINQDYFLLPDWISVATEFICVNLLLNREFSRKGYNQEGIQKYKDDYKKLADDYLYKIKTGIYYDSELIPTNYSNNLGRLVHTENNTSNEIVDNIEFELKNIYD